MSANFSSLFTNLLKKENFQQLFVGFLALLVGWLEILGGEVDGSIERVVGSRMYLARPMINKTLTLIEPEQS